MSTVYYDYLYKLKNRVHLLICLSISKEYLWKNTWKLVTLVPDLRWGNWMAKWLGWERFFASIELCEYSIYLLKKKNVGFFFQLQRLPKLKSPIKFLEKLFWTREMTTSIFWFAKIMLLPHHMYICSRLSLIWGPIILLFQIQSQSKAVIKENATLLRNDIIWNIYLLSIKITTIINMLQV